MGFIGADDVALAVDVFAVAEQDEAVVVQVIGEVGDGFFFAFFVKINEDVAAEDDIELAEQSGAVAIKHVVFAEGAEAFDFGLDCPGFGVGGGFGSVGEKLLEQGWGNVADVVFTVDAGAGFFDGVVADVGADEFEL